MEDQLGLIPVDVRPFGLEGSGSSTPLRIKVMPCFSANVVKRSICSATDPLSTR